MNTALTVSASRPVSVRPHGASLGHRIARRLGLALITWDRRLEARRPTREELAVLHERRMEAARLRDGHYGSVTVGRMI